VVFSEGALAYAPLTLDYNYLRSQIAQLETNLLPKEGTVLGDAVGAALNRLHDEATQRGGAVLLLSDGAVNQGRFPPITAAQLARERGTQVFTIGIGRPDSSGAARRGTVAEANFQPLRQLADSTGGRFYAYTNPDAPGAVADAIHQMNQQVVGKRLQRNVQEYYPLMLGLALGCFLAAMVLIALGFYNAMEGI
jgi:Ca-activated chloride channel family protein